MRNISLLLFFFTLTMLFSCHKESSDLSLFDLKEGEVQMYYNETQCADLWSVSSEVKPIDSYTDRVNQVLYYMESIGIELLAIKYEFDEDNVIACLECHCLSGGVFYIKLKEDNEAIDKLTEMGFVFF